MELSFAKMGKIGGELGWEKFFDEGDSLGYIKFEMIVRHPSGGIEYAVR